jgi:hypothetical protein
MTYALYAQASATSDFLLIRPELLLALLKCRATTFNQTRVREISYYSCAVITLRDFLVLPAAR